MSEFITYPFQNCVVRYFPAADYLETVFQDGLKCPAQFTFTVEDFEKAYSLGYGKKRETDRRCLAVSDVMQMHLEHELSHTFIAEALGEPYCPVLRSVAVKGPCTFAWERESRVMLFQKALNGQAGAAYGILEAVLWETEELLAEFKRRFRK